MFLIKRSVLKNYRVFIPKNEPKEVHDIIKQASMWAGSDAEDEIEGVTWLGYEFSSLHKIFIALTAAETTLMEVAPK